MTTLQEALELVRAKGVTTGFERFLFDHVALPELALDEVDLATTLTSLQSFLAGSADTQIAKCTYACTASTTHILTITNKTTGRLHQLQQNRQISTRFTSISFACQFLLYLQFEYIC